MAWGSLLGLLWPPRVVGQRLYKRQLFNWTTTAWAESPSARQAWNSALQASIDLWWSAIQAVTWASWWKNIRTREVGHTAVVQTWGLSSGVLLKFLSVVLLLRIWWAFWTFRGARIGGSKNNLSMTWAQTGSDLVETDHVLSSRSELLPPVDTTKAYFASNSVHWWLISSRDHKENLSGFLWWLRVDKTSEFLAAPSFSWLS